MSAAKVKAYVGSSTPLAGEYYNRDFDWSEHAQQTAQLVEEQWVSAPAAVRQAAALSSSGEPLSAVAQLLASLRQADAASVGRASNSDSSSSNCSNVGAAGSQDANSSQSEPLQQQEQPGSRTMAPGTSEAGNGTQQATASICVSHPGTIPAAAAAAPGTGCQAASENEWEAFYRAHPSAKFYKARRYLLLEFPCLAPPSQLQHVVEIGAGCGSSILPVLRSQPQARATVCDVSSTCLQQLSEAMQLLGLGPERCTSFVADGTDPGLARQLAGCEADVALIMFTLSAVMPEGMLVMMSNAAASLRPGGVLCIRDHALYDMVQLRLPAEQCIGRHLYRRGDDTLAYFYTCEDLSGLAVAAGLKVVECEYVCVINTNRKSGQELRRAFVHGVFRRPECS